MPTLGRYVIDNPKSPGAIDQLRSNVNKLGQVYRDKQTQDLQRKQKLEDAIALVKAKTEAETQSPLGQLDIASKMNLAGLNFNMQGGMQGGMPAQQNIPEATPNIPVAPPPGIPGQPAFGRQQPTQQEESVQMSLIPDKATSEMTPFGGERIKKRTFLNPQAEEFKTSQAIRENLGKKITEEQYQSNKGVIAMYGQLKSLMSYKAAQFEEAGGDSRPQILKSWILSKIKQPGYGRTGAFFGSQAQTAMRTTPLITGSVRIVRDITKMMFDALPNLFDTGEFTANKSVQSLDDFFRFAKGIEKAGQQFGWQKNEEGQWVIPDEADVNAIGDILAKYGLTGEEEKIKNVLVEDLLGTEPAESYQMEHRGGEQKAFGGQDKGHYIGEVISTGGKKYKVTGGDMNDPDVEEVQ